MYAKFQSFWVRKLTGKPAFLTIADSESEAPRICHRADQNRPLVGTSKPASLRREIHNSFLVGCKERLAAS